MKTITTKQLLKQLKDDLWGKDSQRGYSFTYSWMANQLGHISLGFIPSCLVYWVSGAINHQLSAVTSCLSVAILWTIFEFFNCLGSILKTSKQGAFPTPKAMVVGDTATDVFFFYNGVAWALWGFSGFGWMGLVSAVLFMIVLVLGSYWLRRKMFAWQAGFATQFRLAQFVGGLSQVDIQSVESFLASPSNKHLLISGVAKSGKTLLATGIGTELAYNKQTVIYKTLFKWMPETNIADTDLRNDLNPLWSWREAEVVVVDDVAPEIPTTPIVNPQVVEELLLQKFTNENLSALCKNGFIWVIGNQSLVSSWASFLVKNGVSVANITQINIKS